MQLDLDAAIRTLLLPLRPGTRGEYSDRAEAILAGLGVAVEHADWVVVETARWRDTGRPSATFSRFVKDLLYSPALNPRTFAIDVGPAVANPDDVARRFSEVFFALHKQLMDSEKVSHMEASRILSHTHTIALLASGAGMTASKIYGMLSSDGIVLGKGWSAVRTILDRCGIRHDLGQAEVEAIFNEDRDAEPDLFGDLDIPGSIQHAAEACLEFGYRGDLEGQLHMLLDEDVFHPPYMCMIHFQLTILAIHQNRVANGYEFSPRGQGLLWLARQYLNSGLDVADSPFLNNAKSVDTLDASWASPKKPAQRPSARALADILHEFDTLSDPSRTAGAKYLRGLFHRILRVTLETRGAMPDILPPLTPAQMENLVTRIGAGNTGTTGVLEQRLTDCWLLHQAGNIADWHEKGIGNSVYATNTSKKKFGDAEIKHRVNPHIVAVEAHGGHLSQVYVDDHLSTLRKVLPIRIEELEDRAAIANWMLDLHFISHSADPGLMANTDIDGLRVNIIYHRFSDLAALGIDPAFQALLGPHFVDQLNVVHVPSRFRRSAIALL